MFRFFRSAARLGQARRARKLRPRALVAGPTRKEPPGSTRTWPHARKLRRRTGARVRHSRLGKSGVPQRGPLRQRCFLARALSRKNLLIWHAAAPAGDSRQVNDRSSPGPRPSRVGWHCRCLCRALRTRTRRVSARRPTGQCKGSSRLLMLILHGMSGSHMLMFQYNG